MLCAGADHHSFQKKALPMHKFTHVCALSIALLFSGASLASERPDHYKGEPSNSLPEALTHFSEYNTRLQAILARDTLSAEDLHTVHELTYTLETALARINADLLALGETLEQVHVASENGDSATVQQQGKAYLQTARQLIP
jgi:hypothetical protein